MASAVLLVGSIVGLVQAAERKKTADAARASFEAMDVVQQHFQCAGLWENVVFLSEETTDRELLDLIQSMGDIESTIHAHVALAVEQIERSRPGITDAEKESIVVETLSLHTRVYWRMREQSFELGHRFIDDPQVLPDIGYCIEFGLAEMSR